MCRWIKHQAHPRKGSSMFDLVARNLQANLDMWREHTINCSRRECHAVLVGPVAPGGDAILLAIGQARAERWAEIRWGTNDWGWLCPVCVQLEAELLYHYPWLEPVQRRETLPIPDPLL